MSEAQREEISKYCAELSNDPLLVQGSGGNVSWKDGDALWIKASGTCLADTLSKDIFVPVDLPHLRDAIIHRNFHVTPRSLISSGLKPSIETLLHGILPHTIVVHLHPVEVLSYLVRKKSYENLAEKLSTHLPWVYVPYEKPGAALAGAVDEVVGEGHNPIVVLLENHGVVIGGNNIVEISDLLNLLIDILRQDPYEPPYTDRHYIWEVIEPYQLLNYGGIQNLAVDRFFFYRINTDWALYPDHIVFLGAVPSCYENLDEWSSHRENGSSPELVFVRGEGVFSKSTFGLAKQIQLQCYFEVLRRQMPETKLRTLNKAQITELLVWDAEIYRKNLLFKQH